MLFMDPARPPHRTHPTASSAAPNASAQAHVSEELDCNLIDIFLNPGTAPAPSAHAVVFDPMTVEYPPQSKKSLDRSKTDPARNHFNSAAAMGGTADASKSWYNQRSPVAFHRSNALPKVEMQQFFTQPRKMSNSAASMGTNFPAAPTHLGTKLGSRLAPLEPPTNALFAHGINSPSRQNSGVFGQALNSPSRQNSGVSKRLDLGADACRRRRMRRVQIRRSKTANTGTTPPLSAGALASIGAMQLADGWSGSTGPTETPWDGLGRAASDPNGVRVKEGMEDEGVKMDPAALKVMKKREAAAKSRQDAKRKMSELEETNRELTQTVDSLADENEELKKIIGIMWRGEGNRSDIERQFWRLGLDFDDERK